MNKAIQALIDQNRNRPVNGFAYFHEGAGVTYYPNFDVTQTTFKSSEMPPPPDDRCANALEIAVDFITSVANGKFEGVYYLSTPLKHAATYKAQQILKEITEIAEGKDA